MKTIDRIIVTCMALIIAGNLYLAKHIKATESEYRLMTSVKTRISEKVNIEFLSEDRYKKGNHYWDKKQIGLDYKINDYLTISPKYASLMLNGKAGSLCALNLGLKEKLGGIDINGGLELEYFSHDNNLLTEPHTKLSKPFRIGEQTIVPYFTDRTFFGEGLRLIENRPALGAVIPINKNLSLAVEAAYRDHKHGKDNYMITFGIPIKF